MKQNNRQPGRRRFANEALLPFACFTLFVVAPLQSAHVSPTPPPWEPAEAPEPAPAPDAPAHPEDDDSEGFAEQDSDAEGDEADEEESDVPELPSLQMP